MFFGYLAYRSGNLAICVSVHFFNNFVACVASYMGVADDAVLISAGGKPTGPILLLNAVVFTIIFFAATAYFISVTEQQLEEQA
jgi:membrane protease YdiL (CAAX protease family)